MMKEDFGIAPASALADQEELRLWRALRPYLSRCLSMNHDINNPLAGVLGYAEFILEGDQPLPEELRSQLQQIMHCGERIRQIVDELCAEKVALGADIDLKALLTALEKDKEQSKRAV